MSPIQITTTLPTNATTTATSNATTTFQTNPTSTAPTTSSFSLCTVTGSAVIDVAGFVSSISHHCVYNLLSLSGFEVLGAFQDKRRKDLSLFDHLILRINKKTKIVIGPGNRIETNGSPLNISSQKTVGNVTITKDINGVTAILPLSSPVSIFFNGNTAQIYIEDGDLSVFNGLCADSNTSINSMKSTTFSVKGCETTYKQDNDSSINCGAMTQHCNALLDNSFSTCHSEIDPEPYITACTDTLCKYPDKDHVKCSLHEAYARACSLRNVTLGNWRQVTRCRPQPALCLDTYCSSHEFCGTDWFGNPACFCRAVFASAFVNNTFGEPTMCENNTATVTLYNCLLAGRGIDHSKLHLNDPSCSGQLDPVSHKLTFEFDGKTSCGSVMTKQNKKVIIKNNVMTENATGMVVRHDQFDLEFSCFYTQPEVKSMALKIKDSSVVQKIQAGAWNYSLSMKTYLDMGRTKPITQNTELQLDQRVWVELKATGLDSNLLSLVTESCWATKEPTFNASLRYNLIQNSCSNPADKTIEMKGNGRSTWNYFAFNVFKFSGDTSDVYLHCKVELCVKSKDLCTQVCGGKSRRRRRMASLYNEELTSAFISMAWGN
ncbi:alpha-tectorin-like [Eucyclogobius newberryi]|uniref:alpha-tectorin-like n=1 Tax=Eucyclogobius newberryi TaxID=166745 RepID=UPI003B5C07C8